MFPTQLRLTFFWLLGAFAPACSGSAGDDVRVAVTKQYVIYGADDRIEPYADGVGPLQDAALRATASIMTLDDVHKDKSGSVTLATSTLVQKYGLCTDEPYSDQPSVGFCSGVLVAPDVVLTAGHCLARFSCPRLALVFAFNYQSPGLLRPLREQDVYACAELLKAEVSDPAAEEILDYGFIRLDRRVSFDFAPVLVQPSDMVSDGDEVALVGHAAGLPTKIARDGRVVDARPATRDYFVASVDDFAGGSGSGVFDRRGLLLGIAARGETDFDQTAEGCSRSHRGDPDGGEQITYLSRAIEGLCEDPTAPEPCPQVGPSSSARSACSVTTALNGSTALRRGPQWSAILLMATWTRATYRRRRRSPRPPADKRHAGQGYGGNRTRVRS